MPVKYLSLLFPLGIACRHGGGLRDILLAGLFVICAALLSCGPAAGKKDHPEHFDKVEARATEIREEGDPDGAIRYLDSAYAAFPDYGIGDLYRKYSNIRFCYFRDKRDYHTALAYSDSMLLILQDHIDERKYRDLYTYALLFKGDALFELKRYAESYKYYYKARAGAEKAGLKFITDEFHSRMAHAHYKQGKYLQAMEYFRTAYQTIPDDTLKKDFYFFTKKQQLLNNVALCYEKAGLRDSAFFYYNKALEFIGRYEYVYTRQVQQQFIEIAKGVIYGNISGIYYQRGDTAKAEELLKRSININIQEDYDNADALTALAKLVRLYIESERMTDASSALERLRNAIQASQDVEMKLKWADLQWNYYEKKNDLPMAYSSLKEYMALQAMANADILQRDRMDVNKEFENIERGYQVELLKNQNKINSIYLVFVIIFAVLGVIIILLIWNNWRKSRNNILVLKKLNRKIHFQKEQLEQSNSDKDRMMKVLAHDLRNPIGGIYGLAGLMLDDTALSEEAREMALLIYNSSKHSKEMINDLIEAALNNHKETIRKEETDLSALLQHCADILKYKTDDKGQELVFTPVQEIFAYVDPEKITRLVNNLVNNAIKFSPNNTQITLAIEKKGDKALLSVEDRGIGVPDDLKDKVFDMFTEAKRFGTDQEKPFGLGLSICKQIADAHGGRIWLESVAGQGTVFYVELPLKDDTA